MKKEFEPRTNLSVDKKKRWVINIPWMKVMGKVGRREEEVGV